MNFRRPTVTGKRFVNGNLKSDSESATRTQRLLRDPKEVPGIGPSYYSQFRQSFNFFSTNVKY